MTSADASASAHGKGARDAADGHRTLQELIDAEAKRQCLAAGWALEDLARQDRSYRHDDARPMWQARFRLGIQRQIEMLEKAGMQVVATAQSDQVGDA